MTGFSPLFSPVVPWRGISHQLIWRPVLPSLTSGCLVTVSLLGFVYLSALDPDPGKSKYFDQVESGFGQIPSPDSECEGKRTFCFTFIILF